jgi:ribosome-binding factor A
MSRRTERLASLFRQEIAQIIMRDLADPRLKMSPTVTKVTVTDDLSNADVYISVLGGKGEQNAALHALQHAAGMIRTKLARDIDIRQMPYIRFHYDDGARKEIEILSLLQRLEAERAAKDTAAENDSNGDSEG